MVCGYWNTALSDAHAIPTRMTTVISASSRTPDARTQAAASRGVDALRVMAGKPGQEDSAQGDSATDVADVTRKLNLLDMDQSTLEAWCGELGEKPFRARQLMKWLYHRGVTEFSAMTDLARGFRERLAELAEVRLPEVLEEQHSSDGTRKWLLQMECGNSVEMVFIPEDRRGTLCVSSQVGCALNCSFCSTARQGFNRNLSTGEIVAQLWLANKSFGFPHKDQRRITNVVLMGMGEPLLNFDNVLAATRLMTGDLAFGLGKRRVTLSTAGVVPGIERLARETDISLAVSLHAPVDELRNELVPLNKKYPIAELMKACRSFIAGQPSRRITFEYVMLSGVNDSLDHARALARLMKTVACKVNLIPFNPFPGSAYQTSSRNAIYRFRDYLLKQGVTTVTRKTRGDDIDAACGQLVGEFKDRTRRRAKHLARSQERGQDLPDSPVSDIQPEMVRSLVSGG